MIEITKIKTYGWEEAIRGMRNSYNSWDKSDSEFDMSGAGVPVIGPNDLTLMKKLCAAGTDHCKFRRMITVSMDINAPLYWWKEFDTYKVGTVANSCSTMHKIAEKEFTMDDFSHEHFLSFKSEDDAQKVPYIDVSPYKDESIIFSPNGVLECIIIPMLNNCRDRFLETKDKKYWWQIIQLLPSSYNQRRTVMLNYEVLANIYKSRKNHKLDEWQTFCKTMESTLPYPELFTTRK